MAIDQDRQARRDAPVRCTDEVGVAVEDHDNRLAGRRFRFADLDGNRVSLVRVADTIDAPTADKLPGGSSHEVTTWRRCLAQAGPSWATDTHATTHL